MVMITIKKSIFNLFSVLSSMLDDDLPLTVYEFDEWGNPKSSKVIFDYIQSYDPYLNVVKQKYPPLYLTASTLDTRVPLFHSLKWVAKLRQLNTQQSKILLQIDEKNGHFGDSGR